MDERTRERGVLMGLGVSVGVGVFLTASVSPLGLTLLGRLALLAFIPVIILVTLYGLREYLGIVALILIGGLLRLMEFAARPMIDDGPFYLQTAREFLTGDVTTLGHVASAAIWSIFVSFFDYSGVNVANFIFSVSTIPVVGAITYRLFDSKRSAVGGMVSFAFAPIAIWYAPKAINEPVAMFFSAGVIYFILSDRQLLAFLSGLMLIFMRIEYAFLFVVPFVIFHRNTDRRVRNVALAVPTIGIAYIFMSGFFGVPVPGKDLLLAPLRSVGLFSPVTIRSILQDPAHVFTVRYASLASHLSHFGVPYLSLFMMNPLIPILGWAGVTVTRKRPIKTGILAVFVFSGFWLVVLQTTFIPESTLLGFSTIGLSLICFAMFAFVINRDDTESGALFLATYVYTLGFLLFAPSGRYLHPVLLAFSVYAGHTITLILKGAEWYANNETRSIETHQVPDDN